MLEQSLKEQVIDIFSKLTHSYSFNIQINSNHASKTELLAFLEDVASCSDKISVQISEGSDIMFEIEKDSIKTGIVFKAIPTGHEFTSLLLAILNADGIGKNLPDEALIERIKLINSPVEVTSAISLSCTNCPDVVQALNIIALYNTGFTHIVLDGGLFPEKMKELQIQAVPAVIVENKVVHFGKASLGEIVDILEKSCGTQYARRSQEEKQYEVVIAGGGPAGVSSAIYAARKGFKVAIVAQKIGGQVTETVGIENMISVPYITGKELSAQLKNHINEYKIDVFENRTIEKVDIVDANKVITCSSGEVFKSKALIIATGASWRKLNVTGESKYIGAGVAFCTHCDGPFYKDKKVVVIGGGNSGLEAAIDLSSIASQVTVLEFLSELKGDIILQNKLQTLSNVSVITNAKTIEVIGDGTKVTAMKYKNCETDKVEEIITDGVFVQIGLTANSSVFSSLVETNKIGEILIDAHCRTNTPGIYAAGDVSIVPYKQIVIAMGEGAKASLSAFEDIIKGKI